jgi:hypothetical protein
MVAQARDIVTTTFSLSPAPWAGLLIIDVSDSQSVDWHVVPPIRLLALRKYAPLLLPKRKKCCVSKSTGLLLFANPDRSGPSIEKYSNNPASCPSAL